MWSSPFFTVRMPEEGFKGEHAASLLDFKRIYLSSSSRKLTSLLSALMGGECPDNHTEFISLFFLDCCKTCEMWAVIFRWILTCYRISNSNVLF